MSNYDSRSIEIAFQEIKGLFELTETRGRELLQKSQILLGVSGVLLTLWTNAVLRLFDGPTGGVVAFVVVLGPLGLLTIGALYSIRSITLGDHEVPDKAFLLEPATWQHSPDRVRVAMMKALAKSIDTNETILFMRQRRYKKALRFVTAGLITITLSTVWLLYTGTAKVERSTLQMIGENQPESSEPTQAPATPVPDLADVPPAPTVMLEKAYGEREKTAEKGSSEKKS